MQITYDREADAAYFSVRQPHTRLVARTLELDDWLLADVDANGALLGIEMLFVSSHLSPTCIEELTTRGGVLAEIAD